MVKERGHWKCGNSLKLATYQSYIKHSRYETFDLFLWPHINTLRREGGNGYIFNPFPLISVSETLSRQAVLIYKDRAFTVFLFIRINSAERFLVRDILNQRA